MPQIPSGENAMSRIPLTNRFPSATQVGIQFDWRLKNARLSISIAPLKLRPSENAASAAPTIGVWSGVKAPRW